MSFPTTTVNVSLTLIATTSFSTTVGSDISPRSVLLIVSSAILMISVISGIIGNVLVCVSVYKTRNLRTANNALLVNLAVGDLVVCFTSIPIALAEVFNTYGSCLPYGDVVCSAQTFFHVSSTSVQVITLVAISVERYEAIVHPFETKKKRRRVIVGISVSWAMALVIAVPAAVIFHKSSLYLLCKCRLTEGPSDYVHRAIIAPLGIACLLCVVFFYLRIFRTVRKHVKDKRKSMKNDANTSATTERNLQNSLRSFCCHRTNVVGAVAMAPPRPNTDPGLIIENMADKPSVSGMQSEQNADKRNEDSGRTDSNVAKSLFKNQQTTLTVSNWTELEEPTQRSITPDTGVGSSGIPQENTDKELNGVVHPSSGTEVAGNRLEPKGLLVSVTPATPSSIQPPAEENTSACTAVSGADKEPTAVLVTRRESVLESFNKTRSADIQGSVCVLNPEMRVRGRRNLEAKTAKRASYIIGVFSLCWLPLFVVSYVDSRIEVDILMFSVATMSAALNPVVYTLVNKAFRTEFVKIYRRLTKCCPQRRSRLLKP